jgi:hypothetical protein
MNIPRANPFPVGGNVPHKPLAKAGMAASPEESMQTKRTRPTRCLLLLALPLLIVPPAQAAAPSHAAAPAPAAPAPTVGKNHLPAALLKDYVDNMLQRPLPGGVGQLAEQFQLTPAETLDIVAPLLEHPREDMRLAAVYVVAGLGPAAASAAPKLVPLLADPSVDLRYAAAVAAGRIGPAAKDAVPPLLAILREPDGVKKAPPGVRQMAVVALGAIGPAAQDALPDIRRFETAADTALAHAAFVAAGRVANLPPLDLAALTRLRAQAFQGDAAARAFAALPILPRDAAAALLQEALAAPLPAPRRLEAVLQLGALHPTDPASIASLLDAVASPDGEVAAAAEKAAWLLKPDAAAAPALAGRIDGPDDRAAAVAAHLLWANRLTDPAAVAAAAAAAARFAAETRFERVRETLQFLRSQGPAAQAAAPALEGLLRADHPVYAGRGPAYANILRTTALVALTDVGLPQSSADQVLDLLANGPHPSFAAAARAAAALPDPPAQVVPQLLRALNENGMQAFSTTYWGQMPGIDKAENTSATVEAIRALARLGPARAKAALPALEILAKDDRSFRTMPVRFQDEAQKASEILTK